MQRIVIFYYRTWVCMRVCRRTRVSHFLLIITTTHLIALAIKNAWFAFADFFFFFLLFFSPHRLHDGGRVKARARASSTSQKRPWSPVVCVFFFFGAHAHSGNRKPESAKRREEEGKNGRFISKNFSHWKKKIALPSYWEGGRILLLCTALERGEKIFCLTRIGFLGGNEGGVCRFALFFLPSFSKLEIALEFLFPLRRPCVRALLFTSNLRIRIWGKRMRSWVSSTSFLSPDLNVLLCCGNFFFFFKASKQAVLLFLFVLFFPP